MNNLVGIGAYSAPLNGKLLGTSGCAPCAAAAMGAEPLTDAQIAELQQNQRDLSLDFSRLFIKVAVVGTVAASLIIWWTGRDR